MSVFVTSVSRVVITSDRLKVSCTKIYLRFSYLNTVHIRQVPILFIHPTVFRVYIGFRVSLVYTKKRMVKGKLED